ncbi:MAG: hypothetical protein M1818_000917 [Claussenomyces sp. TS43310]|nr:MAG: hypothetical protein M1818_000917 [Claussenomyces sp. TS43310]
MDDDEDPGDLFSIPDFWAQSRLPQDLEDRSSSLFSQIHLHEFELKLPEAGAQRVSKEDGFFATADLSFGRPEAIATPSTSTGSNDGHKGGANEVTERPQLDDESDVWMVHDGKLMEPAKYLSWDVFEDHMVEEPSNSYITEAGPHILDAALADKTDIFNIGIQHYLVIDASIYASSLLALGLGRNSLVFSWAEEKQTFVPTVDALRLSGCTGELIKQHSTLFVNCGNLTKHLQSFVDVTHGKDTTPGLISLADTISTLLSILQSRLNIPIYSLHSVIQLQALFKPAEELLTCFYDVVQRVTLATSDEVMLSQLFNEIQRLEHTSEMMTEILLEVLACVSKLFLEFVGEWIGISKEANPALQKGGPGRSFVKTENRVWLDEQGIEVQEPDFLLDNALMPSFISEEDGHMIFETGRNLRFLRAHHPEHPLSRPDIIASADPPPLDWKFSWQSIEQVESKALKYEKDLIAAIKDFSTTTPVLNTGHSGVSRAENVTYELEIFGQPEEAVKDSLLASMDSLSQVPGVGPRAGRLTTLLNSKLTQASETVIRADATFAPPISLAPLLSFSPIIAVQARIINSISIRLFFKEHHLREHLSIQRQFQLLGNGVFSSRLSHALFDPELETAERKAGLARTGGIVGLRLGGRDTWPPATSELRLALMGVLTESYTLAEGGGKKGSGGYLDSKSELPGDLSFAVRDMSEEEIEKCVDPNAVEALDFLRLSYKPPPPLEAVITPISLYKYDQLFKLLLRVVRILYVASQLFRDALDRTSYWQGIDPIAQRFRIESLHFVSCISSHFFDVGIDATWRIFDRKLDEIEAKIDGDDGGTVMSQHEGLDKLRDYHERILDRIMFSLLLRKRQQPVMKVLQEIFTLILRFAKHSRERCLGEVRKIGADDEVKEIYSRFRSKVEVFITVCRGLSEKKGYGGRRTETSGSSGTGGLLNLDDLVEENTISQLLARLEMSSYYTERMRASR